MKTKPAFLLLPVLGILGLPAISAADPMTPAYWEQWSPDVQARIDQDIDKNRKGDAVIKLPAGIPAGTDVKIEQITHDFIFGAHIFNFNQLGTPERNRKYKELYGSLFNSATIAFYWKKFEMEPGKPRFKAEHRDTEEYWNNMTKTGDPKTEPHWRRPASDPVVEFCESKGIRMHGHPIAWGNRRHQQPEWIFEQFCPSDEKEKIKQAGGMKALFKMKPAEIEKLAPVYTREINRLQGKRVTELAEYYGGRIHSWDIVNESSRDFSGNSLTGDAVCISKYRRLMPGDYAHKAFNDAGRLFPKSVLLNINEDTTKSNDKYVRQIKDLQAKGNRIDIMGVQFHLFQPQQCLDIADGKLDKKSRRPVWPQQVWDRMDILSNAGLPIHMSEITISAPGDDARGHAIQAVIARNLYRLWFSIKPVMGITWWNVVDGCGSRGEPASSGLFTRDMEPKAAFHALNQLINHEWKTNLILKANENGEVRFRGFKGKYHITYKDKSGREQKVEFHLKNDGGGIADRNNKNPIPQYFHEPYATCAYSKTSSIQQNIQIR